MTIAVGHRRLRRSVERLIDREATTHEAATARAHLQRCSACRAAARLLVHMKAALRRRAHREPLPLAATRLRHYAVAVAEEGVDAN
jgi:predicted anti-sigma-YlaC factor YlaD